MKYYKTVLMPIHVTVLMPIQVTVGDYCFGDGRCCESFDNEGGCIRCVRGFYPLDSDKEGRVLKPKECLVLKLERGQYLKGFSMLEDRITELEEMLKATTVALGLNGSYCELVDQSMEVLQKCSSEERSLERVVSCDICNRRA